MLRDEPIFCCPREPQAAKQNQWTFLDFTLHSHTVSPPIAIGAEKGVLSLVIPTLHINLLKSLRFIECKSVFHNFIHSYIKTPHVSLSFHVKESNKLNEAEILIKDLNFYSRNPVN